MVSAGNQFSLSGQLRRHRISALADESVPRGQTPEDVRREFATQVELFTADAETRPFSPETLDITIDDPVVRKRAESASKVRKGDDYSQGQ